MILFCFLGLIGCHSSRSFQFGAYTQAEHFYEKGNYPKALEKYQEYVRDNPEGNMTVISYYYMAKSYEGLGNPDEARKFYKKIVKEHPDMVWANFSKNRLEELNAKASAKPPAA